MARLARGAPASLDAKRKWLLILRVIVLLGVSAPQLLGLYHRRHSVERMVILMGSPFLSCSWAPIARLDPLWPNSGLG